MRCRSCGRRCCVESKLHNDKTKADLTMSERKQSVRDTIPLGDLELKLQDILHAMQNAMRDHQVSHCAGCFDRLSEAMMKMDEQPESADHLLDDWIAKTRMHRISQGCSNCYMPVYSG